MQSTLDALKRYYSSVRKRNIRGCMALRDSTLLIGAAAAAGAAGLAAVYYVSTSKAEGHNLSWDCFFSWPAATVSKEQGTHSDEPAAQPSLGQLSCQFENEQKAEQVDKTDDGDTKEGEATVKPASACSASSGEQLPLAVNGGSTPCMTQQHMQEAQPLRTAPQLQEELWQHHQQQQQKDVADSHHLLQRNIVDVKQQQAQDASPIAHSSSAAADGAAAPEQAPAPAEQQQQQSRQLERQSSSFKQQLSEWELRVSSPTAAAAAAAAGSGSGRSPALSLSPRTQQQQQQDTKHSTQQQQQQQQEAAHPPQPSLLFTPTRRTSVDSSWSTSSSTPATPSFKGLHNSSSSSLKQRTPINATRKGPSLDSTVSSAVVARSLQMQYVDDTTTAAAAAAAAEGSTSPAPVRPLAMTCAVLCKQHCKKLQDISGELGETTALEIGCGTGGSCFQLALSFSHVLGLDGDPLHVVAAKEMKERGQLEYQLLLDGDKPATAAAAAAGGGNGVSSSGSSSARRVSEADASQLDHGGVTCLATVPDDIDRDKVRFWSYPLPDLPPKLQPVDAVLVEDVTGRLGLGLGRVLQQVPLLLNPQGVCVVVLDGSSSSGSCCNGGAVVSAAAGAAASIAQRDSMDSQGPAAEGAALISSQDGAILDTERGSLQLMEQVKHALQQQGLRFVKEQHFKYPVMGSTQLRAAHAGVWLQD